MTANEHARVWRGINNAPQASVNEIRRLRAYWKAQRRAPKTGVVSRRSAKHDSAWQSDARMRVAGRGYLFA